MNIPKKQFLPNCNRSGGQFNDLSGQEKKQASSLDQINMTENRLEYDQKISHRRTLALEHDQKFTLW